MMRWYTFFRENGVLAGSMLLWMVALGLLCSGLVRITASSYPIALVLAAGMLAGAALYCGLAWRPLSLRGMVGPTLAGALLKCGFIVASAASEEVLWRGIVLQACWPRLGLAVAAGLSVLGFATVHVHQGRAGLQVHTLTGSVFCGVTLVTGSLAAAMAAHATYNLLLVSALSVARTTALRVAGLGTAMEATADGGECHT